MKEQLDKILARCDEIIALGEKATAGPWEADSVNVRGTEKWSVASCMNGHTLTEQKNNAQFIAATRDFTPAAAKAVKMAITFATWIQDYGTLEDSRTATRALQSIINSFNL